MEEIEIYSRFSEIYSPSAISEYEENSEREKRLAEHKAWLQSIRHERPSTSIPFKIGVYIRYFNQTKYENYLLYHKKQFIDTIRLCPKWKFVDFYIDSGSVAPNMESAPEWGRLMNDCMDGKVNLILTQKVSNVSRKINEIIFCSRLLAASKPPIGIYFISEDLYTLASYYQEDLHDPFFLPSPDWKLLPGENETQKTIGEIP